MAAPALRQPEVEVVWQPFPGGQTRFLTCPVREIFAEGNRGGGKRLANDQPVLTDRGWVPAGDVTMQDRLVAPDGQYTRILGIYPGRREPYYRVVTEGGASVVVCGEHNWLVYHGKNGSRDGWRVLTTEQIRDRKGPHYLPLMSAPAPGRKWRGFDPWIVGYLLGNGTTNAAHPSIYTVEPEVIDYLERAGWRVYDYPSQSTTMVTLLGDAGKALQALVGRHSGGDKRIPYVLLAADPDSRLALLQGLMDSDGSVERGNGTSKNPGGQCAFVSVSRHLAEGVQYLVRSLGGKARIHWKNKHSDKGGRHGYWHVSITHAGKFNPFRLPRKARKVRPQKGSRNRILAIEPVGERDGVCFEVEHPSHLFVVKDFIVTHNTETLIMKYLRYVGVGFGSAWTGIVFRREYKHLDDVVKKCKRWIPQIFPQARWLSAKSDYKWVFPDGEELFLRAIKDPDDYWNYHGHEYPFVGWEELTNWPSNDCYEVMKSTNRCSVPEVPRFYCSTGNPYGAGHGWVKEHFIDIGPEGTVVTDDQGNARVRIHVDLEDNRAMMENDPEYVKQLDGIKNPELRRAWRDGDWDIVVGGFLQGIWNPKVHVVKPFEVPLDWPRWRAMDWGFAAPYSIGWYTISPDGVVYRYRELYGYGGKAGVGTRESATEVARKVRQLEARELAAGVVFRRNPADSQIFANDGREKTIEEYFRKEGVRWVKASKGPGSRVNGAQAIIQALQQEKFKVFDTCRHFIRTVPVLMPDPHNWEDVDTEMEDHCWDEAMYSLRSRHKALQLDDAANEPKPGTYDWLIKVTSEKKRTIRV
ncbi:MAG TPA: hypothetical protein ENK05_08810 [Gammaproteobacteria bacterium]|nr:hypothetical protein [Gammaproteobacteria bacterium]